jgi:Ion channel
VRHFHGGIAEWKEAGLPIEPSPLPVPAGNGGALEPALRPRITARYRSSRQQFGNALFNFIEGLSTARLFGIWLALIFVCGAAYWFSTFTPYPGLIEQGAVVRKGLDAFGTAMYFSFVTATSVGYGDVLPVGPARLLAVLEAACGLLIFGLLIAKFVSHRQDQLVGEIHSVTFEERLDRVQTNLHLVVSELLTIAAATDDGPGRLERIAPRLESTTLVFAGELRAIHHLLYSPQREPDEQMLGAILANLASALNILHGVLVGLPSSLSRSPTLEDALRTLSSLANEICANCVPQVYAPALTVWMDRIQQTARTIV